MTYAVLVVLITIIISISNGSAYHLDQNRDLMKPDDVAGIRPTGLRLKAMDVKYFSKPEAATIEHDLVKQRNTEPNITGNSATTTDDRAANGKQNITVSWQSKYSEQVISKQKEHDNENTIERSAMSPSLGRTETEDRHDNPPVTGATETTEKGNCTLVVSEKTVIYWKSVLRKYEPNFIHFTLRIKGTHVSARNDTFMPYNWVWTYSSNRGLYPYLHWNFDFNLTSFGLLDAKTLHIMPNKPYILLKASSTCNVTLGEKTSTLAIANALRELTKQLSSNDPSSKFDESHWCFLADAPGFRDSLQYYMGLYLLYPGSVVNYNCCQTYYKYTNESFEVDCLDHQIDKWVQCTIVPYILGIVIFLYFPLVLLYLSGMNHVSTQIYQENVSNGPSEISQSDNSSLISTNDLGHSGWLFLDGTHPKLFIDVLKNVLKRPIYFLDGFPVLTSRLTRCIYLLLLPIVVYIKLYVYHIYQPYATKLLIQHGVPMGMLSLLGDRKDYVRVFVPILGGPVVMLGMYYVFGFLFLVLPTSLKEVLTLGVTRGRSGDIASLSPLCFTASDISTMSMMPETSRKGEVSVVNYIRGGIYMLFANLFWEKTFNTQINRFRRLLNGSTLRRVCCWIIVFPSYIVLCGIEILMCLLYYGTPIIAFVSIMVRGALKYTSVGVRGSRNDSLLSDIVRSRFVFVLGTSVIAMCFVLFTYTCCLIFIESFTFVSEVFVFCFVAVIVFPSIAFGYLFFFVVLIYYIFRLFHNFGHVYLELLAEAVDVSVNKKIQQNYVTYFNGKLILSNVTNTRIRGLRINDTDIPLPDNAFNQLSRTLDTTAAEHKVIYQNNSYGIRKDLFEHLVRKFYPIHLEALKIGLQLALIIFLLVFVGSLTTHMFTGPSSEISEVMHVIFIVTIGALPRVLEVALSNSDKHIKRDIRMRRLEECISEYWERMRLAVNATE